MMLTQLREQLRILGCEIADKSAGELLTILDIDHPMAANVVSRLNQIETVVGHELETKKVLVVSADTAQFYEATLDADVASRFPSITFEFEEAAKCLSLDRGTASVFHSMRMLEVALRAIYQCLGLPPLADKDRSWGMLLGRIEKEFERRGIWPEKAFFVELHERLNAMRYAQRNTTMHVENVYTVEEARLIFDNTKALIVRIASRMDQDGRPLA
jgi:hypothetical protein